MPINSLTATQKRIALQQVQSRYIKLELLNYQYQTIDELSGVATSGSLTITANGDMRRSGSISLVVKDSTFEIASGGKIWLDKYIRVWVGTSNLLSGEIEWINCGLFIIDEPSYMYDSATNTLTLSLLDLMSKLTGVRNGYLKGVPIRILAGENIRKAIIDTLALAGFTRYIVSEAPAPSTLPNDIEFSQGTTVYEIIKSLSEIYANYEIYFDVNGVFHYRPIPTGEDDPIMVDDDVWAVITISENLASDFQNVKNSIEVYGRTHDPAHFSQTATIDATGKVVLDIADVTEYTEDVLYGFTATWTNASPSSLQINALATLPIQRDNGLSVSPITTDGAEYFVVQYKGTYWRWLGHLQAYGFAEDTNPNSPFYVEGSVGRIRLPLYDGVYSDCLTDDLAQQRAEYELWLHTNMQNSISLSIVPVYWLDVNILVQYTMQRNQQTNLYIIKEIGLGLGPNDNGTVNMIQFYPDSPTIIN